MIEKFKSARPLRNRALPSALLAAFLVLQFAAPLHADDSYLPPGKPDGVALLGPPPLPGSEEAAADLATVQQVFKARTAAETYRAQQESSLSLTIFAPAIGPNFQPGKFPKLQALMNKVKMDIAPAINAPKDTYRRLRPYQLDPQLAFGKPEKDFGYPSGHSSRGMVYALVLSEIFPNNRDAIMEIGRNIGWDRVLIGKHFPTDIRAGRVLAQAIFRELMANPRFQNDLAAVKTEVQAAQAAEH
jgi:acid phosphatase (class A)